jgi:GDP/UDP-N,N'-diacetylbacillosamine 2-epimerase (hydrolysing)
MIHVTVVTSSRADYGLLKTVMKLILEDKDFQLSVIATGSHLYSEFGESKQEIIADGFTITREIPSSSTYQKKTSTANSMGKIISECGEALDEIKPDILLLLGDRFEILASAISATLAHIPIAHIHGGEVTLGSMDDVFRHAITKMSHLHFAATEMAMNRIIQMGELPENVYQVGGLGVDNLMRLVRTSTSELLRKYPITLNDRNLLITFHPDTLHPEESKDQLEEVLLALEVQESTSLIFTAPNIDQGGSEILERLRKFVEHNPNSVLIESLGFSDYISLASLVDGVVGNSSSGLLEIPSLGVGTINIGKRQDGRELASSVINCEPKKDQILGALSRLYSSDYRTSLENTVNPYGSGGASEKILQELKSVNLKNLGFKPFVNILRP